ncbi:hypothetical protein [Nocardia lasii]|uniref:Secreted protein n=1 Tax=Nocardia lasii TaxID=1616107 RepID=A0ABW1JWR6_9NOCA
MSRNLSVRKLVVAVAAAGLATSAVHGVAAAQTGSADTGSAVIDAGSGLADVIIDGSSSGSSGGGGGGGGAGGTQQCNNSTQSGGAGVTNTNHVLGVSGPTSFVLVYETFDIPDRIQVFYQGAQIHDTGYVGDDTNQGTGSARVSVPAGSATSVTVRVTGPNSTAWEYTVRCP